MSLISDALSTAIDRFRRYGMIIVAFAVVIVSMNVAFRVVSNLAGSLGPVMGVAMFVAGFAFAVYLSFVALRFSYRALDEPVFDLSATARGFARLFAGQFVLGLVSVPYVFMPLLIGAALLIPRLEQAPEQLVSALAPLASTEAMLIALPFVLLSFYVAVRLSMASFRIVVRGDGPLAAFAASWKMTSDAFWQVCGYLLIPFGVLIGLAGILGALSMPLIPFGVAGQLIVGALGLLLYAIYAFVVDPTLAIGKAELFETLDRRT